MVQKAVVCPHCKQIIGSEEKVCSWCGAPRRFGLSRIIASTFSAVDLPIKAILSVTIIMYGLSLLLSISGGEGFLSPGDHALIQLGATGTYPLAMYGRYDSLITAIYLHGGLLHLLFNMMALTQLGPLVSQVFGSSRMFSIYTLSGIIGFIVSYFGGIPLTIGASGSICGLAGALYVFGKQRGGSYGFAINRDIGGWVVGLFLFGLIIPGINNWAHAGGLIGGGLTALLLGYNERGRERLIHHGLAVLLAILSLMAMVWSFISVIR